MGGITHKILWQLCAIVTQFDIIWEVFSKSTIHKNDCYGWLLEYLFKLNIQQSSKDPFKLNQIRTIDRIRSKIPNNMGLIDIFNQFENIFTIKIENYR